MISMTPRKECEDCNGHDCEMCDGAQPTLQERLVSEAREKFIKEYD